MSDVKIPPIAAAVLTQEEIDTISGGGCTLTDVVNATSKLKTAYDDLVDFTSYVIERVAAK